jgi:hypothetical protein
MQSFIKILKYQILHNVYLLVIIEFVISLFLALIRKKIMKIAREKEYL